MLAAILFVLNFAGAISDYFLSIAGERIIAWLRKELFSKIVSREIGFFDRRETGELTSRISTDTTRIQTVATGSVPSLIGSVLSLAGSISMLVILSPPLTGVMLLLIPATVIGALSSENGYVSSRVQFKMPSQTLRRWRKR